MKPSSNKQAQLRLRIIHELDLFKDFLQMVEDNKPISKTVMDSINRRMGDLSKDLSDLIDASKANHLGNTHLTETYHALDVSALKKGELLQFFDNVDKEHYDAFGG